MHTKAQLSHYQDHDPAGRVAFTVTGLTFFFASHTLSARHDATAKTPRPHRGGRAGNRAAVARIWRAAGRRPASRARLAQRAGRPRAPTGGGASSRRSATGSASSRSRHRRPTGRWSSGITRATTARSTSGAAPSSGISISNSRDQKASSTAHGTASTREGVALHPYDSEGGGWHRAGGGTGHSLRRRRRPGAPAAWLHFGALHLDLRPPFESASSSSRTRCSRRSTTLGSWRMSPVVRRAGASIRSSAVAPDWE